MMDEENSYAHPADPAEDKGYEDPDTCRICRGEESDEDQLFYPCKCSGSIKYVHQSCLVEWLSHSQKKYCELCKTPFRFTKLYDPNMPRELPPRLFIKQLSIHTMRALLTWVRLVLVAFVWLGWLPWFMRAIWRGMFWLADGNWPDGDVSRVQEILSGLASNATSSIAASATTTGTSYADPRISSSQSTSATTSTHSQVAEPFVVTFVKNSMSTVLRPTGPFSVVFDSSNNNNNNNMTTGISKPRHPSWLSDIKFLNSLTSSPTINNILIDTLEGQLITLLVVICFILICLIREWVVQQQPLANIGDGEREAAVQLIANNRPHQQEQRAENEQNDDEEEEEEETEEGQEAQGENAHPEEERPLVGVGDDAPVERAFFDEAVEEEAEDLSQQQGGNSGIQDTAGESSTGLIGSGGFPEGFPARGITVDGESDSGHLFGQASSQANPPMLGFETFKEIWARGNGDAQEVLRIIHEEGREDELNWAISAINSGPEHGHLLFRSNQESMAAEHFDLAGVGDRELEQHSPRGPADIQEVGGSRYEYNNSEYGHPSSIADEGSIDDGGAAVPGEGSQRSMQTESAAAAAAAPKGWTQSVVDWFWADVSPATQTQQEQHNEDDGHIVEDPALEAPFIPVRNNRRLADAVVDELDARQAAADAGMDANDIEAIEDGDDLEGIMELIGMQGPIFGLLQNAVFSALLITFLVAIGIWLPYLWGKIALVLLANPVQLFFGIPVATVSVVADMALDTLIGSMGYVMFAGSFIFRVLLGPLVSLIPLADWIPRSVSVSNASLSLIDASSRRLAKTVGAVFVFRESDIPMFSILSHYTLKMHEARVLTAFAAIFSAVGYVFHDLPLQFASWWSQGFPAVSALDMRHHIVNSAKDLYCLVTAYILTAFKSGGVFRLGAASNEESSSAPAAEVLIDYGLAVWGTKDRIIAIIMGYALASVVGICYLRIIEILHPGVDRGQRAEGLVAEILRQAGGVLKVILIVGIEMFLFPLYCGTLLDIALLPLFDGATLASRIEFTASSPATSLFVHWFIGTCYMFHFALFVAMCRKIMRTGVLCKSYSFFFTSVTAASIAADGK